MQSSNPAGPQRSAGFDGFRDSTRLRVDRGSHPRLRVQIRFERRTLRRRAPRRVDRGSSFPPFAASGPLARTMDELKDALKVSLAKRGVLDEIKARLRAEVFSAIESEAVRVHVFVHPPVSRPNRLTRVCTHHRPRTSENRTRHVRFSSSMSSFATTWSSRVTSTRSQCFYQVGAPQSERTPAR